MNESSAYTDWLSLYDDAVHNVWKNESNQALKKISMMLFVIKREFERNLGIQTCRNLLTKPNLDSSLNSPDMFENNHSNTPPNLENDSLIISDDEDFQNSPSHLTRSKLGSPEIKKSRRARRLRTHRNFGITTSASPFKKCRTINNKNVEELQIDSPSNRSISVLDKNISCLSSETPVRDVNRSKNESFDFIPSTPIQAARSLLSLKHSSKTASFLSKNLSKNCSFKKKRNKDKNTTLTQMFHKQNEDNPFKNDNEKKTPDFDYNEKNTTDFDSDETCLEADENDEPSSQNLGLTNMLSLINKTDSVKAASQISSFDFGDISACKNLENNTKKKKLSLENGLRNEFKADISPTNLADVNEILAKAQGVPDHQLEAEPIVRGKARKQLPGWACKECEKFYAKQGLSESQVLTLIKCTKHRGYYRPREETCPGFWDLTMPTQIKEQK